MLRITQPVQMTLVSIGLEGKLIGAWVGETRQIIATASASNRVCLNLQGLTFADSRGIELLRTLRREGIPLLGCSPLLEGLLAGTDVSACPFSGPGRAHPLLPVCGSSVELPRIFSDSSACYSLP